MGAAAAGVHVPVNHPVQPAARGRSRNGNCDTASNRCTARTRSGSGVDTAPCPKRGAKEGSTNKPAHCAVPQSNEARGRKLLGPVGAPGALLRLRFWGGYSALPEAWPEAWREGRLHEQAGTAL
jgi:hypothetical protein